MPKIYTKTGDSGETGLFGGGRVGKDDHRVEAYGEVDELNACLGLARGHALPAKIDDVLQTAQQQLFTVGAVLATPAGTAAQAAIPAIDRNWALGMESLIDQFEEDLAPLTQFILPGGSLGASALHLSRTVCRRAERRVVSLSRKVKVEPEVVVYLNRLSDLLFVMARWSNHHAGVEDVVWRR